MAQATKEATVRAKLHQIKSTLFPEGEFFPILSGGYIFREVSICSGLKEEAVAAIAKAEGFWPHSTGDIETACRELNCADDEFADI